MTFYLLLYQMHVLQIIYIHFNMHKYYSTNEKSKHAVNLEYLT